MCRSPAISANSQPAASSATSQDGDACSCSHPPESLGDKVRWKDASIDLAFPPVPIPSRRVFAATGESMLRALVKSHHERLLDSSIGHMFPVNKDRFAAVMEKTADFIIKATDGSARMGSAHEHSCLRTQHFPFSIDEAARDIWLAQLLLAFDDVRFPEEARLEFWNWVEALSIRMINRRTMHEQPRRYPLAKATITLFPYMTTKRRPVMCPR